MEFILCCLLCLAFELLFTYLCKLKKRKSDKND